MKATQVIYLVVFAGIVFWIISSTHLLDFTKDGFEDLLKSSISEPVIPKGLIPTSIKMEAMPNPTVLDNLPFGPYAQMASTGSYQYKDPAMMPAGLSQMKKVNEDLRSFLLFEGVSLSDISDPTVQLPLTQLRADSQKLQAEISVLDKNPGIDSQLTQQDLADIEGSLMFLQRKVRLFETSGVISGTEGFQDSGTVKTRATNDDLVALQKRIYSAILTLSASGTVDPVVQARIKALQSMYTDITDIITKLANGTMKPSEIPVYQEDINIILPNLANPNQNINNLFNQPSGKKLSIMEQQLATVVGEEHASPVFNNLIDKGMFRVSVDLGYNVHGPSNTPVFSQKMQLQDDGTMGIVQGPAHGPAYGSAQDNLAQKSPAMPMGMDLAFDSSTLGMDDRANSKPSSVSRFDWKKRVSSICEQIRLRGLEPEDFGCIPKDSLMSPAYSWRGHAKMVCGRLGATMDPSLPVTCGCPPSNWKGWTLSL
jgi:hypothetical protein